MSCSSEGFFLERHPKLAPVSTFTDGVFIAGCAQGPKDIPDTVAQAGAAVAGQAHEPLDDLAAGLAVVGVDRAHDAAVEAARDVARGPAPAGTPLLMGLGAGAALSVIDLGHHRTGLQRR